VLQSIRYLGASLRRRRAAAADIASKFSNRGFGATGITAHLESGGTLEQAAAMARYDEVSLVEVKRIVI
jgi:hypothetical protein